MFLIEISPTKREYDAKAHRLHEDLKDTQHPIDVQFSTAQVYALDGDITKHDAHLIAEKLLCDPVTQRYTVVDGKAHIHHASSYVVDVWLKPGVTDAVGETIIRSIKTLGIARHIDVKTGDRYIIPHTKTISKQRVAEITEQLLANGVIQQYKIQ